MSWLRTSTSSSTSFDRPSARSLSMQSISNNALLVASVHSRVSKVVSWESSNLKAYTVDFPVSRAIPSAPRGSYDPLKGSAIEKIPTGGELGSPGTYSTDAGTSAIWASARSLLLSFLC